jgi:hypothetical protein
MYTASVMFSIRSKAFDSLGYIHFVSCRVASSRDVQGESTVLRIATDNDTGEVYARSFSHFATSFSMSNFGSSGFVITAATPVSLQSYHHRKYRRTAVGALVGLLRRPRLLGACDEVLAVVRSVGELSGVGLTLECATVSDAVEDAAEECAVADDLRVRQVRGRAGRAGRGRTLMVGEAMTQVGCII